MSRSGAPAVVLVLADPQFIAPVDVRPFGLGTEQIWLSASIGVAVDDGTGGSPTLLLRSHIRSIRMFG